MNPVSVRLLNQQLCAPQFAAPELVVSHLGAVQAQDYRLMRWGVAMRTKRPSAAAFGRAYDSGRIVRLHLLRGTWQLVAGDDYWWMLDLFAARGRRVIEGWMSANHITITDEEYSRVRDILIRCAADCGSATKEDFAHAVAVQGMEMDSHRLSYHIRMAELSGTLCSGLLHPTKATYSLAESRLLRRSMIDRDEALARLAGKYFLSRSPATLEDFVWWSGLNIGDCRRAIALLGNALHPVRWKGREFYLHDEARTRGFRRGSLLLLPPYDEYLIGYKSRDVVLPDDHRPRAHNNSGIFYPIVARDGIICGNWKPFAKLLQVTPFEQEAALLPLDAEWARYQKYLNTTT